MRWGRSRSTGTRQPRPFSEGAVSRRCGTTFAELADDGQTRHRQTGTAYLDLHDVPHKAMTRETDGLS